MRPIGIGLVLGWLAAWTWCAPARGDGDTLRFSERLGSYRVSVFSAPTPFCAGPVDVSVLVQDAISGDILPDAKVTIQLRPSGRGGLLLRALASVDQATNKLFQAARFDLPRPGRWEVEALVEHDRGPVLARFEVVASAITFPMPDIVSWIALPALAIGLYGLHQWLSWRRSSRLRGRPRATTRLLFRLDGPSGRALP